MGGVLGSDRVVDQPGPPVQGVPVRSPSVQACPVEDARRLSGEAREPGARRNRVGEMHHSQVALPSPNDPVDLPEVRRVVRVVLVVDDAEPQRVRAGIVGTVEQVVRREYPVAVHQRPATHELPVLEDTNLSGGGPGRKAALHRRARCRGRDRHQHRGRHEHDDGQESTATTHPPRQPRHPPPAAGPDDANTTAVPPAH